MAASRGAREASARRRRVARRLIDAAVVCMALGVVLALVDYLGPASPHPSGWYRPSVSDLNVSELSGVGALLLLALGLPGLLVAAMVVRAYDTWRLGTLGEGGAESSR